MPEAIIRVYSGGRFMINIFLSALTALIVLAVGLSCFYFGFTFCKELKTDTTVEKEVKETTEEQKRLMQGWSNIINHSMRHKTRTENDKGGDF